jgi:anthranilate synthase component 2
MFLLIDNYDSFTYNLYHYLGELDAEVEVVRNDQISVDEALSRPSLEGIILSPGPCTPNEAGICLELVEKNQGKIPMFGVCLGHQTIAQVYGGNVVRAPEPMHGKVSNVLHQGQGVFEGIPSPFQSTRYHSLVVEESSFPDVLQVTAKTQDDGLIMGLQHSQYPLYGVQFHPESIASEHGHTILKNFMAICRGV